MTQELIDLKNSILKGRYADALAIVDELEGMSKQAIRCAQSQAASFQGKVKNAIAQRSTLKVESITFNL